VRLPSADAAEGVGGGEGVRLPSADAAVDEGGAEIRIPPSADAAEGWVEKKGDFLARTLRKVREEE
jgi:hypothetical protein